MEKYIDKILSITLVLCLVGAIITLFTLIKINI